MTGERKKDRFGNAFAPGLPYARGKLIADTQDDIQKLRAAWAWIRKHTADHGCDGVFNLSGLERGFRYDVEAPVLLDDELAAALHTDRLAELGLEHLGGEPGRHDIMLVNRQTGALLVALLVMVERGDTVIGVSPSYSHPAVTRAAAQAGASFIDTAGVKEFASTLRGAGKVAAVVLTRLAVSYEILSAQEIEQVVAMAKQANAKVLVDDAGGARVGPAVFRQPKALELGADVVATGLDKYGTLGPRLGLLGGERELVERIRVRAIEMGLEARPMLYPAVVQSLEQYDPERVRALVAMTREVVDELKSLLGAERVTETPVIGQLRGEDILEMAMERAGLSAAPIVPYEATAALAMLLLRDHRVLTVHFAGLPPGTSALLIKFLPPETVARFGGARRLARAFDDALNTLSGAIADPVALRQLILGEGKHPVAVASG
jgi:L-seryl-tRNA(Ser) seleniumtransferase